MDYVDIHFHGLCNIDDGAKDQQEMYAMLDLSYQSGVRTLCYTPHYHPGYFGDHQKKAEERFAEIQVYCSEKYPDMSLYLGNELRYAENCVSWLRDGRCRTYYNTRYVLVDFSEWEEERIIVQGLEQLLNAGYLPVLAHIERYRSMWRKYREVRSLKNDGVLMQIDSQSLEGGFGYRVKHQCRHLLNSGLIDLVSSDAHDLTKRPPGISKTYQYIVRKLGDASAQALCKDNALHILKGEEIRKELYL